MFGYVVVNQPELKIREYETYRAYYCGLCHVLKERSGRSGQLTLTYDMTFLILLLTSLYECESEQACGRCIAHPMKKHRRITNKITAYGADMNLALTYHKLMDDWVDEKKRSRYLYAKLLARRYRQIAAAYPRQCSAIETALAALRTCEANNEQNPDLAAKPFGELMAELFVYQEDIWSDLLRRFGFYLGKFIYLMDACDDAEKDQKTGAYNPFSDICGQPNFYAHCEQLLTLMMAECTAAFEKLPLLVNAELLRNILYAGVWTKLEQKKNAQENARKDDAHDI